MGMRTDAAIKILLVVFLSTLAFSGGTFIGKQLSDSQGKVAAAENKQPTYEEEKTAENTFAKSLKTGDCFVGMRPIAPEFSFEKPFVAIGNINYVVAADKGGKGLLIAQANPDCRYPSELSYKCEYWFRSMGFKEPFLVSAYDTKITCPKEYTKENMLKLLKQSRESIEFNLDEIQK